MGKNRSPSRPSHSPCSSTARSTPSRRRGRAPPSRPTISLAPRPTRISAVIADQAGGIRQVPPRPRTGFDRQPDRDSTQSRHAVLIRRVRSRRRPGDDHAARRRQAVHVPEVINEDHYTPAVSMTPGSHTLTTRPVGTRYVVVGDPHIGQSRRPDGRRAGPRPAGRDQGQPEGDRQASKCRNGTRPARKGSRCAAGARLRRCRLQACVRHARNRSTRSAT